MLSLSFDLPVVSLPFKTPLPWPHGISIDVHLRILPEVIGYLGTFCLLFYQFCEFAHSTFLHTVFQLLKYIEKYAYSDSALVSEYKCFLMIQYESGSKDNAQKGGGQCVQKCILTAQEKNAFCQWSRIFFALNTVLYFGFTKKLFTFISVIGAIFFQCVFIMKFISATLSSKWLGSG